MEKKITVGQKVYDNLSKKAEQYEAGDLQKAMTKDWEEKLPKQYMEDKKYCVLHGFDSSYIHVFLGKPKHLPGAIDVKFISRITAPPMTPATVLYRCDYKNDKLEFMWALPDLDIIKDVLQNKNDPAYREILPYCEAFTKGIWVKNPNNPTFSATNN